MAINKVVYDGRTLIDISDSNLTADDLLEGLIAYNRAGERIVGQMAKIVIDNAMSDTSENAVQNKVIKAYVDTKAGGSVLASLFNIALDDIYYVKSESDAPAVISNALNLDGFATAIGTSGISWKKPTVSISEILWVNRVDENYDLRGSAEVKVLFGEAGEISKNVTLVKPGEGKLYACALDGATGGVDTGIRSNYAYTLHAKGYGRTSTSVMIGSYVSNSERTTFRVLPSSGSIQHMWPSNVQITKATTGVDPTKEFEYWQRAGYLRMVQGNVDYTQYPSGNTAEGNPNANLFLLNESLSTSYGYGTLCFAEVLQGDTQIAYYAPYKITDNEVVIINTAGLTADQIYDIVLNGDAAEYGSRILRPQSGTLIEVEQV